MASLEDRLADKEYKYWVKAGICLSYVKSGLEVFAKERSIKTHDFVNANCIGPNQPGNICNHARIEYKRRAGKWISNCCNDCQKYVDEIVKLQVPPFTFNKYNWQNSNIHQWPTDAWEMMKVFMNPGQKVYQKSPKDTDLSGLINFIDHCSVPNVDLQNKINISQVRDGRNSIMHSAAMRITELEFMTYTNYMIGLLEDPLFMCFIPEAQLASSTIKEISTLKAELEAAKESLEANKQSSKSNNSELQRSNQERDDMMLRNAELSQELLTVKKTLQDERLALEKEIKERIETEDIQRQKCDQLQESCDKLREEVKKKKIDVETQLREKVISLESKLDLLQTAELNEKSRLEDLIAHLQKREKELVEKNLKTEKKMKEIEETQAELKLYRTTESENVKELGQLSIDSVKHPVSASKDKLFTEMTVASKSEVNIKMSGDWGTWISGCTFMPNGEVVLCDFANNNIKLLSDTFTIKDSLQLYSEPFNVSPVRSSSAVITLPDENQLQFIQVMPSLKKLDRSINVDRKCWGVQVVDDLFYVTCYNNPGEGEVLVLDMNCTVTHRFGQPDKKPPMFSSPRYITVCPSTRKIFITDEDIDTVSCLMSDGTVVYQYKDQSLRGLHGVCVDGGGNVIVCGWTSDNVQVIRADGTKCCTLLTTQDGVWGPCSVSYRQSDNTLILGCANSNNIFVYKMK